MLSYLKPNKTNIDYVLVSICISKIYFNITFQMESPNKKVMSYNDVVLYRQQSMPNKFNNILISQFSILKIKGFVLRLG